MMSLHQNRAPGRGVPTPTRRVLLTSAALLLSGCALNNPFSSPRAAGPAAAASADVAGALKALTAITTVRAAVASTSAAHAGLAPRLRPLLGLHGSHLAALTDALPSGNTPAPTVGGAPGYAVPGTDRLALRAVLRAEENLHGELIGLAMQARDGNFARLLGSMAAAVSQARTVLA